MKIGFKGEEVQANNELAYSLVMKQKAIVSTPETLQTFPDNTGSLIERTVCSSEFPFICLLIQPDFLKDLCRKRLFFEKYWRLSEVNLLKSAFNLASINIRPISILQGDSLVSTNTLHVPSHHLTLLINCWCGPPPPPLHCQLAS
jgi:hypothetical protein